MNCNFNDVVKKGTGGRDRLNYHLDRTAENTGMTCAFSDVTKRVKAGSGYTNRKDVHLDRMAAYLVAMNGDPNKPEVASAQDRRKYRHDLQF